MKRSMRCCEELAIHGLAVFGLGPDRWGLSRTKRLTDSMVAQRKLACALKPSDSGSLENELDDKRRLRVRKFWKEARRRGRSGFARCSACRESEREGSWCALDRRAASVSDGV